MGLHDNLIFCIQLKANNLESCDLRKFSASNVYFALPVILLLVSFLLLLTIDTCIFDRPFVNIAIQCLQNAYYPRFAIRDLFDE